MASQLPIADAWPIDNRLIRVSKKQSSFHAYVHVPFCVVRCGYCDFNTYTANEIGDVSQAGFHEHLINEIEFSAKVFEGSDLKQEPLSTVFFGGGTPSLFTPEQIGLILSALEQKHGFREDIEITLEANPEGLTFEKLAGYQAAGVNRLSIGVQSFDPQVLQVLDRVHTSEKVVAAAHSARELGLRLSVDLIYGAPGESLESWSKTLREALELQPEHVSAYSLIVEEGTALARRIARGEIAGVDEDLNAEKYLIAEELLTQAGLHNYEVSNWGEPSRHNVAYWQSQNWWGYGPGAHSHIYGQRFWNHKHPANYAQKLRSGSSVHSMESLTPRQMLEEQLLLQLRTNTGVPRTLLHDLGVKPSLVALAIADGLLTLDGAQVLRATLKGRLVVDGLVLDFLTK